MKELCNFVLCVFAITVVLFVIFWANSVANSLIPEKEVNTAEVAKPKLEPDFEVLFPASKAKEESRKLEIQSLHVLTRPIETKIRNTSRNRAGDRCVIASVSGRWSKEVNATIDYFVSAGYDVWYGFELIINNSELYHEISDGRGYLYHTIDCAFVKPSDPDLNYIIIQW